MWTRWLWRRSARVSTLFCRETARRERAIRYASRAAERLRNAGIVRYTNPHVPPSGMRYTMSARPGRLHAILVGSNVAMGHADNNLTDWAWRRCSQLGLAHPW